MQHSLQIVASLGALVLQPDQFSFEDGHGREILATGEAQSELVRLEQAFDFVEQAEIQMCTQAAKQQLARRCLGQLEDVRQLVEREQNAGVR